MEKKNVSLLAPLAVAALLLPACASDEAPSEDPGSNDEPISTIDDHSPDRSDDQPREELGRCNAGDQQGRVGQSLGQER